MIGYIDWGFKVEISVPRSEEDKRKICGLGKILDITRNEKGEFRYKVHVEKPSDLWINNTLYLNNNAIKRVLR
jgi:hypothetical protein